MLSSTEQQVTEAGWIKGILFSILASIIGGASKLAIRKSWLMEAGWRDSQPSLLLQTEVIEDQSFEDGQLVVSREAKRVAAMAWTLRLSGMMGMTFLNPFFSVLAMNYASPSILAPFSGLTLVWIVLLSGTMIGEHPTWLQIVAAGLIMLGEVVVAAFGDHKNDEGVTVHDVLVSYQNPLLLTYFAAMVLWMGILFYWMKYSTHKFLKRFAWGVSGGSLTGLQNFLKDALTILKARHGRWFGPTWSLALMVSLAIATAFSGLLLLTACMKRYDATYSAAMFVGSFVISASVMSAVHYNTFDNLESLWNFLFYPVGLIILMAGVYILVLATKEGEDERIGVAMSVHSEESVPLANRTDGTPKGESTLLEGEEVRP